VVAACGGGVTAQRVKAATGGPGGEVGGGGSHGWQ
jgi:hypothetical protein